MDNKPLSDENKLWEAVIARNREWDGQLVFGVKTTGIYCMPSCPSKRPARSSVLFFATNSEAQSAGFLPCKRCQPDKFSERANEFNRIMQILDNTGNEITSPAQWAHKAGISVDTLRRMTLKNLGILPRNILNQKKITGFRSAIQNGEGLTASQYSAGYGSSSRLYEKAGNYLGMTPGQYRRNGKDVKIIYAIFETRLGWMLIAGTERGVCSIQFGASHEELIIRLRQEFSAADLEEKPATMAPWIDVIKTYLDGKSKELRIPLDINSTAFRAKVWEAIREIPYGETRSYARLAEEIGQPSAARAVASACAANPVALATPCHRVIHGDGTISGYRWGMERKKELLSMEEGKRK
jgi:AraC family transcriptional regulator of adaptative response/methylated-DNA-[protein]-cysteine methyltransferase